MSDQSGTVVHIDVPYDDIADVCRRYHIRRLALFGSVLRDDFDAESDVNMLVEFETGHTPDFFTLYDIEQELSRLLDYRQVDLVTPKALNRHVREQVINTVRPIYEQN